MKELMEAIAQTLRNLGFTDAVAGGTYVSVRGCDFYADYWRNSFTFCGRKYKSGNTLTAVLDLIQELPRRLAQREKALRALSNENAANALTRQLDDPSMTVSYYRGKFTFTFVCEDLSTIAPVAERIATEMAAASEAAWQEILVAPRPMSAKFTAEGGFSLN